MNGRVDRVRVLATSGASLPVLGALLLCARNAAVLLRDALRLDPAALSPAEGLTLALVLAAHLFALGFFALALRRLWRRYDALTTGLAAGVFAAALFTVAFVLTCRRPEPGWIGWVIGMKVYWYLLPVYFFGSLGAGLTLHRLLVRRTLGDGASPPPLPGGN